MHLPEKSSLTDVLLHIPDRKCRRGQFEPQAFHLSHGYGVVEAMSLQESGGHLLALHSYQNLLAAANHTTGSAFVH